MRRIIVISDLHIGGAQLPMLGHPELLCRFLEQVGNYRPSEGEKLELVINGDFVDFLAIEPYAAWTPSESEALPKLNAACRQFASVFDELAKCIAKVDYFTILLGNHDIESAYPRVHEALLARLGTDPHRCLFISNNQAYRRGDVLIEHGNRYDAWNAIDYEDFQKVLSRMSRLEQQADFEVCPGSRMVEQMVNRLKLEYPFIDLLKPETKVLPLVLSALEPSLKRDVKKLFELFALSSAQWMRTRSWLPAIENRGEKLISATSVRSGLPQELRDAFADELSDVDETEAVVSVRQKWNLVLKKGRSNSLATKIRSKKAIDDEQLERVRLSLSGALKGDRTFDDDGPDGPYEDAARKLIFGDPSQGARPKIAVMGHTHLIRNKELDNGRWYLNTGTWVDLVRVPNEQILGSPSQHAELDQWLRNLLLDTNSLRVADPAYADILLDDDGSIRQPDNRPLLRRLSDGPFSME
jgi:UDP-2,3-diacylglucosamine pyrophosphatase LpxH